MPTSRLWLPTLSSIVLALAGCAAHTPTSTAPAAASPAAPAPAADPVAGAGYDPALAQRLGADEYGMAKYVMAFLKAGAKRETDPARGRALMAAHLANIQRLAEAGSLVIAGPFLDDGALRGIYIFKVATLEEARALTATDPAIQSGHLEMELHPWYGSAALAEVNALHKRVQKKSITDR